MTVDEVVAIVDQGLFVVIKVAAPVLLICHGSGIGCQHFSDGYFHSGADTYLCAEGAGHFSDDYADRTLDAYGDGKSDD